MLMCVINFSAYCDGHLLVFSETHLDIFNTQTAEWVQSIGLKRSRPMSNQGNLALTFINDSPIVVYLANMHISEYQHDTIVFFLINNLKLLFYYLKENL